MGPWFVKKVIWVTSTPEVAKISRVRQIARDYLGSTDVFLFEFTSQMSLDEGGLADTTITDHDQLEFSDWLDAFGLLATATEASEAWNLLLSSKLHKKKRG